MLILEDDLRVLGREIEALASPPPADAPLPLTDLLAKGMVKEGGNIDADKFIKHFGSQVSATLDSPIHSHCYYYRPLLT